MGIHTRIASHPAALARNPRFYGLYGFLNGGCTIAVLGALAKFAHSPLIFPSLGPTAFLLFHAPLHKSSSPRNTLLGHLFGVLAGLGSLWLFGLAGERATSGGDIGWARIGAAALSLALTSGLMSWFDAPHPPAGATTMIISLGLLPTLADAGYIMAGVAVLVVLGFFLNRLAGFPYPVWWDPNAPE